MQKKKALLKHLAVIRKRAGKVRDMDVFTTYATTMKPEGEDDCRVQLLEHLGATRKKDAGKLHRAAVKRGPKARNGLKGVEVKLEKILCLDGNKNCDLAEAPAQTTASALELESKLSDPPRLDRSNLHPYRLKVKELHNVLRVGENRANRDFVQALNSVKDAIGEWHDWEELLTIAKDVLDHSNCKLIRDLKSTADRKYTEARAQAENMRKRYLRIDRGKKVGIKKNSAPEPAWVATTSLAA